MKTKRYFLILLACLVGLLTVGTGITWAMNTQAHPIGPQVAVGTGFTYQGYLDDNGSPADGAYDFYFDLFDAQIDGASIMTTTVGDVAVADGLFTVMLDFGPNAFDGDARWLEIGVRPGAETGAYTTLTERQQITPAPYALYALEAGSVDWADIANRPLGLDDGDDNSTYSAGFGLNLDGAIFAVMTDTIQARVAGGCEIGSTVRVVNADGSVECEPHDTRPVYNQTALDTTGFVGKFTSIAIGVDGLPIIGYGDQTNYNLEVAHCNDLACTTAITSTLDTSGRLENISIAIGADGLPILSYYLIESSWDLKVAHCDDIACTSADLNSPDTTGEVGAFSSITIGVDGLPIISYYDATNDNLKVAHCSNKACSAATITPLDTPANDVGLWTSITIGADGLPIISYKDETTGDVKVAHCDNITCTSAAITPLVTSGDVGDFTNITIGNDGLPIILYRGQNGGSALSVAHCDDLVCSGSTNTDLYWGSSYVQGAITIGADGLPVISFRDNITKRLMVAHCYDVACTTSSWVIVDDTSAQVGQYNSITIGTDGMPIISYWDNDNGDLKVTHCSNIFCVPYWRRR
ncbi:hypothetical protein ACFLZW_06730 [Chloroflexota bacterium]